jgi:hypothetical protein
MTQRLIRPSKSRKICPQITPMKKKEDVLCDRRNLRITSSVPQPRGPGWVFCQIPFCSQKGKMSSA